MKRIISILLLIALLLSLAGCGGSSSNNIPENKASNSEEGIKPADNQQALISIVDKYGKPLGSVDSRASCTAVDGGIFYSIFELTENQYTATAEYHFFSKNDNKDILLGTLADQGYEAIYTRTELNGKVYTLALQGYPFDDKTDKLLLLEFDPSSAAMQKYTVSENGSPYAAMAVHQGKLLIMNHETTAQKADAVYEFDPGKGAMMKVLSLPAGEESLRGICEAEEGVYMLRVNFASSTTELFIDSYDAEYHKTSERSLNELFLNAYSDIPGFEDRQDTYNEFYNSVSRFKILDGRYMIYENFGRMRIAADIVTGEVLFADIDSYAVSLGSGSLVIYHLDFEPDNVPEPEIYLISDGSLKKHGFKPVGSEKMIRNLSHSAGGTWLVLTTDSFRIDEGSAVLYMWTE